MRSRLALCAALSALMLGACDSRQESTPSTQPSGGAPGNVAAPSDRVPGDAIERKGGGQAGSSAGGNATEAPAGAGASEVGKQSGNGMATGGTANAGTAAPASPPSADGAPSTRASATSAADRDFLATAASSGLLEVEASRLAGERASAPAVKAFAEHMQKDHAMSNAALAKLAESEGVELPQEMSAKHRAQVDRLGSLKGAAFDREYAQAVGVAAHREAVQLFERVAGNADDPEVKAFAEKHLPILRDHLKEAETLQQTVSGGRSDTGKKK